VFGMSTLFFSYSHKDEALRDELEVHLAMLKRDGLIDAWHDRRILAGDVLDPAIDSKLDSADIILLLCSPEFLNSKYCYDVEMQRAMERHERGEGRVIVVILRPCEWQRSPFAKLVVTPTDGKPISKWPDRDDAFQDVVRQIRAALPSESVATPAFFPARHPTRTTDLPRSSNLRLRKEFTEAGQDRFLDEAFEYIARFFEGSLAELERRNEGIETRFRRIDAQAFGAVIYRNGKTVARCGIRHGGGRSFGKGITFSQDDSALTNSMNESLHIDVGEQALSLKGMDMFNVGRGARDSRLTPEGAAEYYWSRLIEPLQQ